MRGFFKRQRQDVEPFGITVDREPRREDVRKLEEGLDGHAVAQAGVAPPKPVAIYVRDQDGHIVGGLSRVDWGGTFHIRLLWVHADFRGEGYGTRLVHAAEQEAVARGCCQLTVSAFSYQAPGLYARLGFEQYAVLDNVPVGHSSTTSASASATRMVRRRRDGRSAVLSGRAVAPLTLGDGTMTEALRAGRLAVGGGAR